MSDRITGRMRAMPIDPDRRARDTRHLICTALGIVVFAELCFLTYALGRYIGNHI